MSLTTSKMKQPYSAIGAFDRWAGFPMALRALIYLIITALLVGPALVPGAVYITGNLHDVFLPINAARAIDQGLQIHDEFASPFGILFFYLASAASQISGQTVDIYINTSLVFFALFVPLFLWTMRICEGRLPWWIFVAFAVLIFSPRGFAHGPANADWYGVYNRHLWSILLLGTAIALLSPFEAFKKRVSSVSLGLFFGVCITVAFYYKFNFFLALVLTLGAVTVTCERAYALKTIAIACGTWLTTALFVEVFSVISHSAYLENLALAVAARGSRPFDPIMLTIAIAAAAMIVVNVVIEIGLTKQVFLPMSVVRHILIAAAITIASVGDFRMPVAFFGCVIALNLILHLNNPFSFASESGWRKAAAIVTSIVLLLPCFILDASSLVHVGLTKVNLLPMHRNERLKLVTPAAGPGFIDVVVPDLRKLNKFSPNWRYRMTYQYFVENVLPRPKAGETPEEFGQRWIETFALATPNGFDYRAQDYVKSLREVLEIYRDIPARESLVISTTEFSNPFPAMFGLKIPGNSLHWQHPGTTIPLDDMSRAKDANVSADIVLLPVWSPDSDWRSELNTTFIEYNSQNGDRFCNAGASFYWIHYIRCSLAEKVLADAEASVGTLVTRRIQALNSR